MLVSEMSEIEFGDFIVCTFQNDTPTLFMQQIEIDHEFFNTVPA